MFPDKAHLLQLLFSVRQRRILGGLRVGKQGGDQPGGHCSLTGHGAGQEPCRLGAYLEKVLVRQHVAQQGRQQGGDSLGDTEALLAMEQARNLAD